MRRDVERIVALERLVEAQEKQLATQAEALRAISVVAENNHKRIARLEKALGRVLS